MGHTGEDQQPRSLTRTIRAIRVGLLPTDLSSHSPPPLCAMFQALLLSVILLGPSLFPLPKYHCLLCIQPPNSSRANSSATSSREPIRSNNPAEYIPYFPASPAWVCQDTVCHIRREACHEVRARRISGTLSFILDRSRRVEEGNKTHVKGKRARTLDACPPDGPDLSPREPD